LNGKIIEDEKGDTITFHSAAEYVLAHERIKTSGTPYFTLNNGVAGFSPYFYTRPNMYYGYGKLKYKRENNNWSGFDVYPLLIGGNLDEGFFLSKYKEYSKNHPELKLYLNSFFGPWPKEK
jgi:hypothetical protein